MPGVALCCNPSNRASSASSALADESHTVCIDLEGRIHYARGCAVAAYHLANLLHHHRLRCGDADGIDVRGGDLDCGDWAAQVECVGWGLRHANRGAFLRRAAGRRDSQRAMAGALDCW